MRLKTLDKHGFGCKYPWANSRRIYVPLGEYKHLNHRAIEQLDAMDNTVQPTISQPPSDLQPEMSAGNAVGYLTLQGLNNQANGLDVIVHSGQQTNSMIPITTAVIGRQTSIPQTMNWCTHQPKKTSMLGLNLPNADQQKVSRLHSQLDHIAISVEYAGQSLMDAWFADELFRTAAYKSTAGPIVMNLGAPTTGVPGILSGNDQYWYPGRIAVATAAVQMVILISGVNANLGSFSFTPWSTGETAATGYQASDPVKGSITTTIASINQWFSSFSQQYGQLCADDRLRTEGFDRMATQLRLLKI